MAEELRKKPVHFVLNKGLLVSEETGKEVFRFKQLWGAAIYFLSLYCSKNPFYWMITFQLNWEGPSKKSLELGKMEKRFRNVVQF